MENQNSYVVYIHICPNKKVYIGYTGRKPEIRWNKGKAYFQCSRFYKAIQEYGWDNIEHKILFSGLTMWEARKKEKELIKQYQSNNPDFGYNVNEKLTHKKIMSVTLDQEVVDFLMTTQKNTSKYINDLIKEQMKHD